MLFVIFWIGKLKKSIGGGGGGIWLNVKMGEISLLKNWRVEELESWGLGLWEDESCGEEMN